MAYSSSISIALGTSKTGLTLQAQLIDTLGNLYNSPITTGFVEIGGGNYLWTYNNFPDNFQGGVKFLDNSSHLMAFASINPSELDSTEVESGITAKQVLAVIGSAVGGVLGGAGTTNVTIQAVGNADVNRISAVVDNSGNRRSITLNLP